MKTLYIAHTAIELKGEIHILSEKDGEEGDWIYYKNGDLEGVVQILNGAYPKTMVRRKIVMTTNKEIGLPLLNDEWVKLWKQTPLETVYVNCTTESECSGECGICSGDCNKHSLHINSNGVIDILRPTDKFIEPLLQRAGDPTVMVNGHPVRVDFRIIAEDNYQFLIRNQK